VSSINTQSKCQKTLREWEVAMEERPEEVKRSGQGKRAAAMQMQTANYLKPLFKQLKSKVSSKICYYNAGQVLTFSIISSRWNPIF
jgi:hypothetical protein